MRKQVSFKTLAEPRRRQGLAKRSGSNGDGEDADEQNGAVTATADAESFVQEIRVLPPHGRRGPTASHVAHGSADYGSDGDHAGGLWAKSPSVLPLYLRLRGWRQTTCSTVFDPRAARLLPSASNLWKSNRANGPGPPSCTAHAVKGPGLVFRL